MAKIIQVEAKEAATVQWVNTTGSAVSSGDLVSLGANPNKYVGVAMEDIAATATGTVLIRGRVALSMDSGNGGAIGQAYYVSGNALTIMASGSSATAFAGWGASSILSTDASGTKIQVDLPGPGARPSSET